LKLRIEVIDGLAEDEAVIRCGRVDETIQKLQEYIKGLSRSQITFYKELQEFYMPVDEILFFETGSEQVYAHTKDDSYKVRLKLYELETVLPRNFVRAAKGAIVNTAHIYSINRNLASSSQIRFIGSHKQVYVSRHYYQGLKYKMNERR
jgi:DNA-binding LytR/AlgR family response regulator